MGFRMFRIGRAALGNNNMPNEIQIDHPTVSRSHLSVFINDDNEVFITDLDSANGTYVNGNRISGDYQLKAGDILKLGMAPPIKWTRWLEEEISEIPSSEVLVTAGEEEQIDTKTELSLNKKKSSTLRNLVILLLLFLVAGGGIYFVMRPKTSKPLTKAVLQKKTYEEIKEFAKNKDSVSDIKNGDTINIKGKVYVLTVQNGRLEKIEEKVKEDGSLAVQPESDGVTADTSKPVPVRVDSSKIKKDKRTKEQQQTDIKFIDDRDNDGIADDEDRCPDDPKNKCLPEYVIPVNPPEYKTKVLPDGEYLDAFISRLNSDPKIKAQGSIGTKDELIKSNPWIQASNNPFLTGGEWIKFILSKK